MKRLKLLLMTFVATAAMTGCTKEYITEQYITETGAQVKTYEYTVTPSMWQRAEGLNLPGANNYLYATFENGDITEQIFNQGAVTADIWNIYDTQNNLGSWNPLPYVFPLEIWVEDENGNPKLTVVPENIRMEWELGRVTFIIQDLDGYDPEDMVTTVTIRVNVIG